MNILYDISLLGHGFHFQRARTGVFRVVENVAEELLKRKELEITLCGGFDLETISNSLDYVEASYDFKKCPFSLTLDTQKKIKILKKKNLLIQTIHNGSLTVSKNIAIRFKIRELLFRESFLSRTTYSIDPSDLDKSQIYHSPFYPISDFIKNNSLKKSVFLTSYDLIPILYPQFCEESMVKLIKDVVNSITWDTWVLCISKATRNDLLNYLGNKVDPKKVVVTELAASTIFYPSTDIAKNKTVREKYNIPDGPYILSLCTLEPRKNIDQAIRAFSKIIQQERITDLYLVLVGTKGWMFDKIFDELNTEKMLKERIIIAGYVSDEDLSPLYSGALFFVYPSLYEGFGLPPLEAMQCGTPVITSNVSSLPEVVGDAGIMVSPTDTDELSAAMLSLYKNSSTRSYFSEKAIERASRFSWKRCADETIAAYNKSLA